MADNTFYIITSVDIELVMPDGTTRTMTLEAPNSRQKPYEMIAKQMAVNEDYRDPRFQYQRGHKKFYFEFVFGYDWHTMDLTSLLAAETVKLQVPVYLWEDSRYYQEFDCKLLNTEFSNAAKQGLYAQGSGRYANRNRKASQELRFRSPTYEWDEYEDKIDFLHPVTLVGDDGEPIIGFVAGEESKDGEGVEAVALEPAEYGAQQTYNYSFGSFSTINLESNNE